MCYVKNPDKKLQWATCLTPSYRVREYRSCHPDGKEPCMFPFEYEGITYTGCAQKPNGATFCLTKKNTTQDCARMIYHEEKSVNNNMCIFPMEYRGIKYNECVYTYGFFINWGFWCYVDDKKTQELCQMKVLGDRCDNESK